MILFHWLCLILSACLASAANNEPALTSTKFDHGSSRIAYFDDSPTILNLNDQRIWKSDDNGVSWSDMSSTFQDAKISFLHIDKYHKERVFAISDSQTHWFTNDKGKSWKSFTIDEELTVTKRLFISENMNTPDNVLFKILDCSNIFDCTSSYYYTNDQFAQPPKKIESVANPMFCAYTATKSNGNIDDMICISNSHDAKGRIKSTDVIQSKDYFKTSNQIMSEGLSEVFIYDFDVVESFIVIKAFTDRYSDQSYVQLFVSKDGIDFKKANFPGDLKSESFIILPSNENSLYVSVWGLKKKISTHLSTIISDLYASDSDGFTFRKLDNLADESDYYGFHSVEKISNLDGVWLGNIMAGYSDFSFDPLVKSMISMDDGRSWNLLKYEIPPESKTKAYCNSESTCHLQLIDAIEMTGDGNFESGPTPGILLGVGAVSDTLVWDYEKLSTWVSRDGGYSWFVALDEPCVFSIGDQGNVIVAIPYYKTGSFSSIENSAASDRSIYYYSVDQGTTWKEGHFDKGLFPTLLTTTIDGSSQKFIFAGYDMAGATNELQVFENAYYVFSMDFSDIFGGKTCGNGDMEEFVARSGEGTEDGICIMGHKEKFQRRKKDAECFVNKLYQDVEPTIETCDCTIHDFECQKGFRYENGECVADLKYFRNVCVDNPTTESHMAKISKIPGNTCNIGNFKLEDKDYFDLNCRDLLANSPAHDIRVSRNGIPGSVQQYVYLDQSADNLRDETVLVLTSTKRLYISHNGGLEFFWASVDDEDVLAIVEDKYNSDHAVLLTPKDTIYVTKDRAQSFQGFKAPSRLNPKGFVPLFFHPNNTEEMIFIGETAECAQNINTPQCSSMAYLTKNGGETWVAMLRDARSCDFAGARFKTDDELIICERVNNDGSVKILSSRTQFQTPDEIKTHFEHAVGIATDDKFIVVADIIDGETALKSLTTLDGETFAHAKFPHDFNVDSEQAYTVFKTFSKSIYLHVTTSNLRNAEFGSILKSNSNGTSYVLSEDFVNRDAAGYVDFEKIQGIEGVAVINVVSNHEEVVDAKTGASKKLKTKITHNDAAEWAYLAPPAVDSEGNAYPCVKQGKPFSECSLNLHGFTERVDFRDTYSSGSAVGMMIGVGNVGDFLDNDRSTSSTFLTRDGGITWTEIHKKAMSWEYGDQGSILMLVDQTEPTKEFTYSLDEGLTWQTYEFTTDAVMIKDIATIPSDTSRRFILFTSAGEAEQGYSLAFGIDFSNVFSRQCSLDLDRLESPGQDFEYWSPKHPFLADNCLFGHEARYLRRKPEHSDCFIGAAPLNEGFKVLRNCSCTRRDYECDYNFARSSDGTCKLIPGLKPKDPKEMCVNDKAVEYFEPTGYRRVPLSTCVGGMQLDHYEAKPCPGKESQYDKLHGSGLRGFNLFLVIVIPIAAFFGATWFVYDRGIRRNGGFERLGAIRLEEGDDGAGLGFPTRVENTPTDKVVNKLVDLGVMMFMGSVAIFHFIQRVRKNVTSGRSPFATNGRGRYSSINNHQVFLDDDEDFLGSEEEDDDVDGEDDQLISNPADEEFDDDARSLTSDILNDGT
ncbi:type I sorting receptor [Saccharomycopsis crataegensis]|uniref:Type I sorting receptor n=1 Tax=Saccharomycopsis crataegensis TaxID=43959 RepID=A0AAV5QLE8_9ASCO|nr:type I sorting receptor [Saccharomycopsis crataegensis]